MIRIQLTAETYALIDEIVRIGNDAVARAQEDSRRASVPNVYSINGHIYYETPSGELSSSDPLKRDSSVTEQRRAPDTAN